jgi:lipase
VTDQLVTVLRERLGADFRLVTFECDHMVAETKPAEVAALIRERLV